MTPRRVIGCFTYLAALTVAVVLTGWYGVAAITFVTVAALVLVGLTALWSRILDDHFDVLPAEDLHTVRDELPEPTRRAA